MEFWRVLLRPEKSHHRDVQAVRALSFHRCKHGDLEILNNVWPKLVRGQEVDPWLLAIVLIYFAIKLHSTFCFCNLLNIEYKFRRLRGDPNLKMPHPSFGEWLTSNELAITLHPTWILTQGVPTRLWARPPTISYLPFQAAETVQDLS